MRSSSASTATSAAFVTAQLSTVAGIAFVVFSRNCSCCETEVAQCFQALESVSTYLRPLSMSMFSIGSFTLLWHSSKAFRSSSTNWHRADTHEDPKEALRPAPTSFHLFRDA